jgi:hypothetical protein
MPDLVNALEGMFDGGDTTIFQATIDAVGQGVVTIHFNGGTFTDVPYLATGFSAGVGIGSPAIGGKCYVIGRKGWGLLVIGEPAPGPSRGGSSSQTFLWDPFTLATYNEATGAWTVPTDGRLVLQTDADTGVPSVVGAFFYRMTELGTHPTVMNLATASLLFSVPAIDFKGLAADNAYISVGLINNATPSGPLSKLSNPINPSSSIYSTSFRIYAGEVGFFTIPLAWGNALLSGLATGIFFSAEDYPPTISGGGTVRLTTL